MHVEIIKLELLRKSLFLILARRWIRNGESIAGMFSASFFGIAAKGLFGRLPGSLNPLAFRMQRRVRL
jgi:hypothetical protein